MEGPIGVLNASFRYRRHEDEIIVLAIRWYISYRLSLRDLVEMLADRGLEVYPIDDLALGSEVRSRVRDELRATDVHNVKQHDELAETSGRPEPSGTKSRFSTVTLWNPKAAARSIVLRTGIDVRRVQHAGGSARSGNGERSVAATELVTRRGRDSMSHFAEELRKSGSRTWRVTTIRVSNPRRTGFKLRSTRRSEPSLQRANSSRPAPIGRVRRSSVKRRRSPMCARRNRSGMRSSTLWPWSSPGAYLSTRQAWSVANRTVPDSSTTSAASTACARTLSRVTGACIFMGRRSILRQSRLGRAISEIRGYAYCELAAAAARTDPQALRTRILDAAADMFQNRGTTAPRCTTCCRPSASPAARCTTTFPPRSRSH